MSTQRVLAVSITLLFTLSGPVLAAHVHFIHQSTGDNWLKDYDEWDPDWGGGNLRVDLESDGHTVTDNWYWDDNAPYCEWDSENQGLCSLFINGGARLPAEAKEADIIIIKSCYYPTEYLTDDDVLNGWIDHSITDIVQGYMNAHPEQNLLYCSSVPHHREGENCPPQHVRARGRAWGEWLEDTVSGVSSYATHGNVVGFSAFGLTARPTGQPNENTLKAEYEISDPDNHMNRTGNGACATQVRILVNFFDPFGSGNSPPVASNHVLGLWPNPCSEGVRIRSALLSNQTGTGAIYDLAGKLITPLPSMDQHGAQEAIRWDLRDDSGRSVVNGTYVVVAMKGEERAVRRLIVTR